MAIATVTATLKHNLETIYDVSHDVSGATVTTLRPDSSTTSGLPNPGVNIFLYQAVPNAAWRNTDLPTRSSNGDLLQRPRAALDLHYLFTFYGDEARLEPQRLLGSVVRTIYSRPVLTRKQIQDAIASALYSPILTGSNLADDVELVKFTPLPLTLEELSKLWSVFFEVDYVLSIAYQATTVLIEPEEAPPSALPVRKPLVYVLPFRHPSITAVQPQMIEYSPTASVTVLGSNLSADPTVYTTAVLFSSLEAAPTPPVQDRQLTAPFPAGMRAGVTSVKVVQRPKLGEPPTTHPGGFESNVAALVVQPKLNSATFGIFPFPTPQPPPGPGISVNVAPAVGATQQLLLLLNQFSDPPLANPLSFTLQARHRSTDTDPIIFDAPNVPAGTYVVRIRIDGADSNLVIDTDSTHTTFNMPIGPKVVVS